MFAMATISTPTMTPPPAPNMPPATCHSASGGGISNRCASWPHQPHRVGEHERRIVDVGVPVPGQRQMTTPIVASLKYCPGNRRFASISGAVAFSTTLGKLRPNARLELQICPIDHHMRHQSH